MGQEEEHYSRYLTVKDSFCPVMTREVIDETPRRWMDYYPHESFLELLDMVLKTMHGGEKPIWVVGNYGTGKTNTALVIQKLFMDDESRVDEWFDEYGDVISPRFPDIQEDLMKGRAERTFVVYDYNSSGLRPDREFIVRLEKTIVSDLRKGGYIIPSASPLSQVVERVKEEGPSFERKLDELRGRFQFINESKTVDDVVRILESTGENDSIHALGEVEEVLRARDIFLDIDVKGFRSWVAKVCEANGFGRIMFIFDEFSDFISNNTANLKTFEELAESPNLNRFMFMPITHLGLAAFKSDTSNSAEKSVDRYRIKSITMPDNIAFELMAHAISKDLPESERREWEAIKTSLWASLKDAADKLNSQHSTKLQQTLEDMLPIHPMTGYMLKTLSVVLGSNQRSIFNFLSDDMGSGTFKRFLDEGGPGVWGKTLLTIDYLWDFFMETDSLETGNDVSEIHSYYVKFRNSSQLRNRTDDDPDIRVLKTVLLFVLLSKLATDGAELLQPTRENIKLSYMGDSSVSNIDIILDALSSMSIITVLNDGMICLFTSSVEDREAEKKAVELGKKFDKLNIQTKEKIEGQLKSMLSVYPRDRFDIKVTNPDDVRVPNDQFIGKYGNGNGNEGAICLWFVIAKDNEESLRIIDKVSNCYRHEGSNCRLAFFSFDNVTFCSSNRNEWNDYVLNLAKAELEISNSVKQNLRAYINRMESAWLDKIVKCENITVYYSAEESEKISWGHFKRILKEIDDRLLENNIDHLVTPTAFCVNTSNLKGAAMAGATFTTLSTRVKNLLSQFIDGYGSSETWFSENPDHTLTKVHDMIIHELESDLSKSRNFNLDKVYDKLKRAPFGFRPVTLTAMALGFCMKELIDGRYQWTDGKMTGVLDAENLAIIIESTLNGPGANNRNRKEICRLTPEDQAFISHAPRMFGVQQEAGSIKEASALISNRFESISGKVPIWVIPDYVRSRGDQNAESIAAAIDDIATVLSISAKGDMEKRTEATRDLGRRLIDDPDLPDKVEAYIRKDTFKTAFREYIRNRYLEMDSIAEKVKDHNSNYTESILNKMAETSSFLWKEDNLDENVNQVIFEYRVIEAVQDIANLSTFIDFRKSLDVLENGINDAPVPLSIISRRYPQIPEVIESIRQLRKPQSSNIMEELADRIEKNRDAIHDLFFDNSKGELIGIVKGSYDFKGIQDDDVNAIVKGLFQNSGGKGFSAMSESDFIRMLESEIERYRINSLKGRIGPIWMKKTGTSGLREWESANMMPARYAFPDMTDEVFAVIRNPDSYAGPKLTEAIEELEGQDPSDVDKSREKFIEDMVPEQYRDLIDFPTLVQYLQERNPDPSSWRRNTDLKPLIHRQYSVNIVPKAKERINRMSPDDLKKAILDTIENNEGLGIELIKAIR